VTPPQITRSDGTCEPRVAAPTPKGIPRARVRDGSGDTASGSRRDRRARGVTRAGLLGALLLATVLGYVIVESFQLEAATCEVCMSYGGRTQCRSVSGSDTKEARQAAITNACAFLSSGVTDTMACGRQKPASEKCE
jgi:hypothetical protein